MDDKLKSLRGRINELNTKSTQILIFLSFALTAAAILWSSNLAVHGGDGSLRMAMRHWVWALFPTIGIVAPLKDFFFENPRWYNTLRISKVVLLWIAVVFIVWGTWNFCCALGLLAR